MGAAAKREYRRDHPHHAGPRLPWPHAPGQFIRRLTKHLREVIAYFEHDSELTVSCQSITSREPGTARRHAPGWRRAGAAGAGVAA